MRILSAIFTGSLKLPGNVVVTVNTGLTIFYWKIGNRIRQDILKAKRVRYGKFGSNMSGRFFLSVRRRYRGKGSLLKSPYKPQEEF